MGSTMDTNAVPVEDVIKHIPRAYQEELFSYAQRANVIATLDTGSGKTFIAALLIKWICSLPSSIGKKVVFLVPKVPLVDQHCEFLTAQTSMSIRGYKGAMGVDEWDQSRWRKEFVNADVLVMTAQIFKNILTHAYWNMNNVSLLIFDECHHANNNHPYNVIMSDHYIPCTQRPKIFGMTASPIWRSKDPMMSLQTLQRNLLSMVYAVRHHADELHEHSNKPEEVILRFSSSPDDYPSYYKPTLWDLLDNRVLNILGLRQGQLSIRYDVVLEAVGPVGADFFVLKLLSSKLKDLLRRDHAMVLSTREPHKMAQILRHDEIGDLTDVQGVGVANHDEILQTVDLFKQRLLSSQDIPQEWLSPKIRAVVEVLARYRTNTFQGIIFVEQRHVASTIAWILPRIAETKGWLSCGQLTGHGEADASSEAFGGMSVKAQRDVVRAFKNGELNLLIATSVAEEGLDFPACQLVIRFDPLKHMIGYVQSRGRARRHASTFVVMIEENDDVALAQYEAFHSSEPVLKKVYQTMNEPGSRVEEEEENDEDNLMDLAERETYIISSTGATLTYNSAIGLLDHLCAIIPRDKYTPAIKPVYRGTFQATLRLPSSIPLSKEQLTFQGPLKHSKKEAKRAVAFLAVKQLHIHGAFDDHLSPAPSTKGDTILDADGRPVTRVDDVPPLMDVRVVSPWKLGPPWYLQIVQFNGKRRAGFISGSALPAVDICMRGNRVILSERSSVMESMTDHQFQLIERYTKMGLWWFVTAAPIDSPLASYLVPLGPSNEIDWAAMEKAVATETGSYDWSTIGQEREDRLLLMNGRRYGHTLLLRKFRSDISLEDPTDLGENASARQTYAEYFTDRYSMNGAKFDLTPPEGPVLEVTTLKRQPFGVYERDNQSNRYTRSTVVQEDRILLPQSYCKWIDLPVEMAEVFATLSPLCQRISDIYRARAAKSSLHLPPIEDSLTIEALTTQDAIAGFNNQRLETLGDGVLKLAVVVYLFNRFPHKHEGQLDKLKDNSVSNRFLLTRAKAIGLEHYITGESRNVKAWQYIVEDPSNLSQHEGYPSVNRVIPRRNLQDCMEALLGASFLSGGIEMAVETGAALGLCFGGSSPWPKRYASEKTVPVPAQFKSLEAMLGYEFKNGELLLEAFTHPSFENSFGTCYQRLEFLGDALVGLVVTAYVYEKFPQANSGQITRARDSVICNTTQSAIAVQKLSLHKYLLANNVNLSKAISKEDTVLSNTAYSDFVDNNWKFDPPKVLADIFESLLGAMFVDCNFDYDRASQVVRHVMEDVLDLTRPDVPLDPVSMFYRWVGERCCQKVRFERVQSNPRAEHKDAVIVLAHGNVVVGPIVAANISQAKGLASKKAKAVLSDESSELSISRLCDCMKTDAASEDDLPPSRSELSDETEEGFAQAVQVTLSDASREVLLPQGEDREEEHDGTEQEEVEMILCTPSQRSSALDES